MNNNTFQMEQNALLQNIINPLYGYWQDFGDLWYNGKSIIDYKLEGLTLELYITPECNQNCEYCYLVKNRDEIYPKEIRDHDTIINNLNILLQYYKSQGFAFPRIDLFSGEIWGYTLGNRVFDTILKAIQDGLYIREIVIPSNMSFLANEKTAKMVQQYIDKFLIEGSMIIFSASVDGKIIEEKTRPYVGGEKITLQKKNDDFYDRLFKFLNANHYCIHPMVSAAGIEHWIENYDWWWEQYKKYQITSTWHNFSMFLEVRNDDWTDEKILSYLKVVNHMIEKDMEEIYHNENIEEFYCDKLKHIDYLLINKDGTKTSKCATDKQSYLPYDLSSSNTPGCTVNKMLCIRLGDLSIVPCHRTSYNKFIYGHYNIENNKITGLTAENINLPLYIYTGNFMGAMNCGTCPNVYCIKGCFGAQYEATGEILYPIRSVCELGYAKTLFLYYKHQEIYNKYNLKEKVQIGEYLFRQDEIMIKKMRETEIGQKWDEIIKTVFNYC